MNPKTNYLLLALLIIPCFWGCPYRKAHHPGSQLASVYQEACFEPIGDRNEDQNICREIIDQACRKLFADQESDAEFILSRAVTDHPGCFSAAFLLSVILFQEQRFEDSLNVLDELGRNSNISYLPVETLKSAIYYRLLGDAKEFFLQNRYRDSLEKLKILSAFFTTDSETALLEMKNYQAMDQTQTAIGIFQSCPQKNDSFELLSLAGTLFISLDAFDEAESVLNRAYRLKNDLEVKKQLEIVRIYKLKVSDNVNRIDPIQMPWVTREDLADLLMIHFDLRQANNEHLFVLDIEESWAENAIQICVNAGLVRLSRDHRFFPKRKVRRMDLALALFNLGSLYGVAFESSSLQPVDISKDHYAIYPIVWCLEIHAMELFEDGTFRASEIPSGEEVLKAIEVVKSSVDAGV